MIDRMDAPEEQPPITHQVPRGDPSTLRCLVQIEEGGLITWDGRGFVTLSTHRDSHGDPETALIDVKTWKKPGRLGSTLYSMRTPTRERLVGRLVLIWHVLTGRVSRVHVDVINHLVSPMDDPVNRVRNHSG